MGYYGPLYTSYQTTIVPDSASDNPYKSRVIHSLPERAAILDDVHYREKNRKCVPTITFYTTPMPKAGELPAQQVGLADTFPRLDLLLEPKESISLGAALLMEKKSCSLPDSCCKKLTGLRSTALLEN